MHYSKGQMENQMKTNEWKINLLNAKAFCIRKIITSLALGDNYPLGDNYLCAIAPRR